MGGCVIGALKWEPAEKGQRMTVGDLEGLLANARKMGAESSSKVTVRTYFGGGIKEATVETALGTFQ